MNNQISSALRGEKIIFDAQTAAAINQIVGQTGQVLQRFNNEYHTTTERQQLFAELTGRPVATSTEVNAPFYSDFGQHIFLGEQVFINRGCMFVDLGGIYIGDRVLIGPQVKLLTVNHEETPATRRNLLPAAVHIKDGAWLGAGVTVLPGVTIGENAIIGAGALVTHDVPANQVAVGSPAKVIRSVRQ